MPSLISWITRSSMAALGGKSSLRTKMLMVGRSSQSPMTDPEFPPRNTSMFSSAFTGSSTVATRRETVSGSVWSLPSPAFMAPGSKCSITRRVSSSSYGFQRQPVSHGWQCASARARNPGDHAFWSVALSRHAPVRADRAGNVGEGAIDELGHQQAAVVHRSRHGYPSLRDNLEPDAAVIGLVADQHHEAMPLCLGFLQRAIQ